MKTILNYHRKSINLIIFIILINLSLVSQNIRPSKDITLDTKIGQMVMIGFRGLEANKNTAIFNNISIFQIGGVVLFDYDVPSKNPIRNIQSPGQVKSLCQALQRCSKLPLLIAIDQEGGRVNRLKARFGFPFTVSAQYLGKLDNLDTTKSYAEMNATTLANLGINLNFAPAVDLNINPDNPVIGRIERSFSADPDIVIKHAMEIIKIHHQKGILCAIKHFPGHGSSKDDSHLGFVDVTSSWSPKELEPFRRIINSKMSDIIMTAHIFNRNLDPKYPATLSKQIISNILRDSLGYDGVVVSDDMQMRAIADHYGLDTAIELAINAGVDMVIFGNNGSVYIDDIAARAIGIIKKLVQEGKISSERIEESYNRIMKLKMRLK